MSQRPWWIDPQRERSGFTLVELLAVILVVGLMTAVVALRVSTLTHRARFEWGLGQLMSADSTLRNHARHHGRRATLELELGTGRITRGYGASDSQNRVESLGARVTVRRFLSAMRDTTAGRVVVDYSPEGISPTYALELIFAGNTQQPVWLIFVGTTGRCQRLMEERDVIQLVKKVASTGDDAG